MSHQVLGFLFFMFVPAKRTKEPRKIQSLHFPPLLNTQTNIHTITHNHQALVVCVCVAAKGLDRSGELWGEVYVFNVSWQYQHHQHKKIKKNSNSKKKTMHSKWIKFSCYQHNKKKANIHTKMP